MRATPDYRAAAHLRAALRRLAHSTELVAKRNKLTSRRYELLLFVQAAVDEGAPATVASLCEPLQTTQGSVTTLVSGAERAGLIKRTPNPTDGRSSHFRLTQTGRRRLNAVYTELGPEREQIADIISRLPPTY